MRLFSRFTLVIATAAIAWCSLPLGAPEVLADYGWDGKRRISYQQSNDLFYNYYVGPGPSGVPAQMYVSPQPVPAYVGHTYITYQPVMPHEFMYRHHRATYNYQPGAGWTRTKARYHTGGTWLQHMHYSLHHRQ